MKKVVLFSAIILGLIPFLSCEKEESKDVSQDKIYCEYELLYSKDEDKTYASASFKFSNAGGTALQLSAPSEVKFNTDVLPFDGTFAYYRKEYAGLVNSGTFTFKDKDGIVYTNAIAVAKVISNPTLDTIARNNAFTYTWVGDSVKTNELVSLVIGANANPLNLQLFTQNAVNATNLILPVTKLNQLSVGMSYCKLDRSIETTSGNFTSAGGKIRGKYYGLSKNVYVK